MYQSYASVILAVILIFSIYSTTNIRNIFLAHGQGGGGSSAPVSPIKNSTKAIPVIAEIPVTVSGQIAFNPANGNVYAANRDSKVLSEIDGKTNKVITNISGISSAGGVAFDSANGYLYVANQTGYATSEGIVVLNPSTNHVVGSIHHVGIGGMIAVDSKNDKVYVANETSISVIDDKTNKVINNIFLGSVPNYMAVANGNLYVTNPDGHQIFKNGEWRQKGIEVNPVTVIDGKTNKVVTTIPFPNADQTGAGEIAVDSANGKLYVIGNTQITKKTIDLGIVNSVYVIDDKTNKVVTDLGIPHLSDLVGIAFNSANGNIYLTNSTSVTVIDGKTNNVISTIPISSVSGKHSSMDLFASGYSAGEIALNSANGRLYVTTRSGTLSVISTIPSPNVSKLSSPQITKYAHGYSSVTVVSGVAYYDKNANGKRDPGEPGIPHLAISAQSRFAQTTLIPVKVFTSSNGSYSLPITNLGTITLVANVPPGYSLSQQPTDPTAGKGNVTGADFGFARLSPSPKSTINNTPGSIGSVSGVVYFDKNANGVRDPGEKGIPDVNVSVEAGYSHDSYHNLTSSDGSYSFHGLENLKTLFFITSKKPHGYFGTQLDSHANPLHSYTLSMPEKLQGVDLNNLDFGYAKLSDFRASISGFVYLDKNANGIRDKSEKGMSNITMKITDNNGTHLIHTYPNGSYSYHGLIYPHHVGLTIRPNTPNGYFVTQPRDELFVSSNNLTSGTSLTDVDFGYAKLSDHLVSISGVAYLDENGNGIRDNGEHGIPNLRLTLYDNVSHKNTVMTTENGSYSFSKINPGPIRLTASLPGGYMLTTNNNNTSFTTNSTRVHDINFGFSKSAILQLSIKDRAGKNVTGVSIDFIDPVKHQYIDSIRSEKNKQILVSWFPNKQVQAVINLEKSPFRKITNDTVFTLGKPKNTGVITLDRISKGILKGRITDPTGKPLPSFVVTASQTIDKRDWFYSAVTGGNGYYNMSLLQGGAKIEGSNSDYVLDSQKVMIGSDKLKNSTVLDLSARFEPLYSITANIKTKYIGGSWTSPPLDWVCIASVCTQMHRYGLTVTDARGNQFSDASGNQYPLLIRALPKDKITACVDPQHSALNGVYSRLSGECHSIILTNDRNVTPVFDLAEHGHIRGSVVDGTSGKPVSFWHGKLYSLNNTGYRTAIATLSNTSNTLDTAVPSSGSFQLDIFNPGEHKFGQITRKVSGGTVVDVGKIRIYNQTLFGNTNNNNGLSAIPLETSAGSEVTFVAHYNTTSKMNIKNATLLLEVPARTTLINGSITINGKPVSTKKIDPFYEISLGDLNNKSSSGIASYSIRLDKDFNASGLDAAARLSFFDDISKQMREELIGTTFVDVPGVSILAPRNIASLNTTLSGQAPVGSRVEIYDGSSKIGEANTLQGGLWNLEVVLPHTNQTLHQLHALVRTNSSTISSKQIPVIYDPTGPRLIELCMDQPGGRKVCFDPSQGVARFAYFVHQTPLVFQLRFNKPKDVSNVFVMVAGKGGGVANATRGHDGLYRTTINPRIAGPNGGLGPISVFFVRKSVGFGVKSQQVTPTGFFENDINSNTNMQIFYRPDHTNLYRTIDNTSRSVYQGPRYWEEDKEARDLYEKYKECARASMTVPSITGCQQELDDWLKRASAVDDAVAKELEKAEKERKTRLGDIAFPALGLAAGGLLGEALSAGGFILCVSAAPCVIILGAVGTVVGGLLWIYDPSGYTYETVPTNRLEGVSATIIFKNSTSTIWSKWDAAQYGQINPQSTDPKGLYAWNVPEGEWQVIYEKPGYQQAKSKIMYVPPPRTGVNIGMVSMEPPKINGISAIVGKQAFNITAKNTAHSNATTNVVSNSSSINIQFSKYIPVSNLTNTTIMVFSNEGGNTNTPKAVHMKKMEGRVIPIHPLPNSNGTLLTRQASFVPTQPLIAGNSYTVSINHLIQSYAGIPMSRDYNNTVIALPMLNYTLTVNTNNTNNTSNTANGTGNGTSHPITTLTLGQALNATTKTNDAMSTKTTYTWYGPNNTEIGMETVNSSNGTAKSSPFTPTEPGIWHINANFTDGNTIFQTKSQNFTVLKQAAPEVQQIGLTQKEQKIQSNNTNAQNQSQLVNAINKTGIPNGINQTTTAPLLASNQNVSTSENKAVNITITGAVKGQSKFIVTTSPLNGAVSSVNSSTTSKLLYTPNHNFVGHDRFIFKVVGSQNTVSNNNSATISITVNPPPPSPPIAIGQTVSTTQDRSTHVSLIAHESNAADLRKLRFSIVASPMNGQLNNLNSTIGSVTYTPHPGFIGNDVFSFKVNDGPLDSSPALINLNVKEKKINVQTNQTYQPPLPEQNLTIVPPVQNQGQTNQSLPTLDQNLSILPPNQNLSTGNASKNNVTSEAVNSSKPSNFLTYKNTTYGFRVDYPSNWTKIDGHILHIKSPNPDTEKVQFTSPDTHMVSTCCADVHIEVIHYPNMTMEKYTNMSNEKFTNGSGIIKSIESTTTTLGGNPAFIRVWALALLDNKGNFTGNYGPQFLQVWTVKDNTVYLITAVSQAKYFVQYLPTVQKMIDSFQLIPATTRSNNSSTNTSLPQLTNSSTMCAPVC